MGFNIPKNAIKEAVFAEVAAELKKLGLKVADIDNQRPWGGFFVIADESESQFINLYFPEVEKGEIYKYGTKLRPKILLVGPHEKLSWQYHDRRAELWKVVAGPVGITVSNDDNPPESPDTVQTGEFVQHDNQVRHRLMGLDDWGVVAEIWQHTDPSNPSEEEDIVRLEDSYGRS